MYTDILYLAGTVAFFAAMLAYVRALRAARAPRGSGAVTMGPDSLVGGVIALAILMYLLYSLLNPERF